MGRYLERVLGVPVPDPGQPADLQVPEMLAASGLTIEGLRRAMWPGHSNLETDPKCRFALKRGGFVLMVANGVVVTVFAGKHYRDPSYLS